MFRKKSHSKIWFVCASWPVAAATGEAAMYVSVLHLMWLYNDRSLLVLCFYMDVCWLLEP